MAVAARITQVGYQQTIEREDGTEEIVDLSLAGRFYVVVDYFESTNPSHVYVNQTFDLPVSMEVEDVQERIVEFGRRVRDARLRVGQLQQYQGAVISLD